jgi:porin
MMIRNVLVVGACCVAATAFADDAAPAVPQKSDKTDEKKDEKKAEKPDEKAAEAPRILPVPDYSGDVWSRSTMSGDWGGRRQQLAEDGIQFKLGLTQIYQRIGHGGKEDIARDPRFARSPFQTISLSADHAAYSGSLDFTFDLDTGPAHLWPGGLFHMRAQSRWGSTLNDDAGTISPINADSLYPTSSNNSQSALTAMNYTQFLSEKFGVTLGRYDTTEGDPNPFAADETDTFENLSFTQPMTALRTVPQTALGGGVVWVPTPSVIVVGLALDSEGRTNTTGFDTIWHNGTTLLGTIQHDGGVFGLPGGQRIGGTWSNKKYVSLSQDTRFPFLGAALLGESPTTGDDSWCLFADGWQYLHNWEGAKDKGWGVFSRIGCADAETNPFQASYVAGVGGQGGLFDRKNDAWGVGGYYLDVSHQLHFRHLTSEKGLEAFYSIGITGWMHLTPSVQLIDPFIREFHTTLVGGVRLQIDF